MGYISPAVMHLGWIKAMSPEEFDARFRKLRFHIAELEGEPYDGLDDDFLLFHITALREALERIDPRFYPYEILTWTEGGRNFDDDTGLETITFRCDQDEAVSEQRILIDGEMVGRYWLWEGSPQPFASVRDVYAYLKSLRDDGPEAGEKANQPENDSPA